MPFWLRNAYELALSIRNCPLYIWGVPYLLAGFIYLFHVTPLTQITSKGLQERVGPIVLLSALIASCLLLVRDWKAWNVWLSILLSILFVREMDFGPFDKYLLLSVFIVLAWGVVNTHKFSPEIDSRLLLSLLVLAFWIYFNTQVLDHIVGLNQDEMSTKSLRITNALEETGETCGHLTLLFLTIASWRHFSTASR